MKTSSHFYIVAFLCVTSLSMAEEKGAFVASKLNIALLDKKISSSQEIQPNQQFFSISKTKNQLERIIFNPSSLETKKPPPAKIQENVKYNNTGYTKNYCVRLCDGFYFPVVTIRGNENNDVLQEQICASFCPGANTSFYRSQGSGQIASAVNTQS